MMWLTSLVMMVSLSVLLRSRPLFETSVVVGADEFKPIVCRRSCSRRSVAVVADRR